MNDGHDWPEDWESDSEYQQPKETFTDIRKWQDQEFEIALKFEQSKEKQRKIIKEEEKPIENPTTMPILLTSDGLLLRFRISLPGDMKIYQGIFHASELNKVVIAKVKFESKLKQNIKLFYNGKQLLENETLTQSAILHRTTINCQVL